ITEWNEVKPKRNEAVRGSFEIPKEAFAETDSYTMNFWLVNTYSQDYILDFDDVKLSHSWGSGITRICSYFENREVSSAPYKYNIKIEELNMYTIVKDGENIKIYINGVYNEPETINRKSTVKLADIADKKDAQFIVNADYMIDEMSFYNRALSGAEIEALVGGTDVTIDGDSIDYGTDSMTLDINVSNAMKNNLNLFVALYSYDGELLDTFVYKSTMPIVNEKITCTLKDDWDGDNIKAYLWDSNMKPLCAAAHEW
ncbi:MAG: hypothetical protein IJX57_01865, partial [Clostridia bacterium]|nr:hypothetical protein [Clostridia bacterium]